MFLKIFKHAFNRPLKTVLSLIVVCILAGALSGVCKMLYDNVSEKYWAMIRQGIYTPELRQSDYLMSLFRTLSIALIFAIIILSTAEIWIVYSSFKKAVATDEAYLTYTLPATRGQQTGARYLALLSWNAIICIGTFISFICRRAIIGKLINSNTGVGSNFVELEELIFFIEILLLLVVIFASGVSHGQFAIVFSNALSLKLKRRISTFLIGFIFFVEIISLILVLIVCSFVSVFISSNYPHFTVWLFIVLIGSLGGLTYYLTYKFMGRRLNVA